MLMLKMDELPSEPILPEVALCEFRGGNQLPIWDIAEKDFKLKKQDSLVPLLLRQWEVDDAADLLIRLGGKQIHCNRLRFMCHSLYVLQNLKGGQRELVLPEDRLTPEGLAIVCDWIVSPNPTLGRRHIIRALAAAMFLDVDPLVKQVWNCLDMTADFSEDQAFALFNEATQLSNILRVPGLDTNMLHRIQRFFLTLVASREFVQLPLGQVCVLLKSQNVAVNSEQEVFFAAVRWLTHDWATRSQHLLEIMSAVRLMLLPRDFLVELQSGEHEAVLNCIVEQPEFRKIIYDAHSDHTLLVFNDGSEIFSQLYDIFDIEVPARRPFICDNLCPYHSKHPHDEPVYFSYRQFLCYLGRLQSGGAYTWKGLKVTYVDCPYRQR